jgi:hypothetical protein
MDAQRPMLLLRAQRGGLLLTQWRHSMQRKHLIMLGAATALLLSTAAMAKPQLTTDTAHGVNFANYKHYTWYKSHPSGGMNSVQYQRIQAEMDSRLAGKGYQKGSPPDLTLALTVGKRQKIDVDTWNRYGWNEHAHNYTEGQVSVDAFDSKTKQAVWHGQVTDTVRAGKTDPEKLHAAVTQLMDHFPGH